MGVLMQQLTDDTKAILLLCCRFGKGDESEAANPLSLREYNLLAHWLGKQSLRPSELLHLKMENMKVEVLDSERIQTLLSRGTAMALSVEKWITSGIWIISRSDEAYPQRLKRHLKMSQAPPVLFGIGDIRLLSKGGLGVVGSRHVDASGEAFTRDLVKACAREGIAIISGGARGVDQIAMLSALEEGGDVIGILADSLSRNAVAARYRSGIMEKRLVLVSPFNPDAGFHVGNAMGRNKLIYALSDFAMVVSAEKDKGGTWTGAKEELRRFEPKPVFVRISPAVPEGNRALIDLGARPFPDPPWTSSLKTLLSDTVSPREVDLTPTQGLLFDDMPVVSHREIGVRENSASFEIPSERVDFSGLKEVRESQRLPETAYDVVLPLILKASWDWKTPDALTEELGVRKGQLEDWVKRTVREGKLEKKMRPVRYRTRQRGSFCP